MHLTHPFRTLSERNKRRLRRVAPLAIWALVTAAFVSSGLLPLRPQGGWLLPSGRGLNLKLPAARLPVNSRRNKLAYYHRADEDSARRRHAERSDPYYHHGLGTATAALPLLGSRPAASLAASAAETALSYPANSGGGTGPLAGTDDSSATAAYRQLEALRKALVGPIPPGRTGLNVPLYTDTVTSTVKHPETSSTDPEIAQLNTLMDKILAVQHPASFPENKSKDSVRGVFYPVSRAASPAQAAFHGADEADTGGAVTLKAYVPETQHVSAGGEIWLALSEDLCVKGRRLPRGSLVYGSCRVSGQRLLVDIPSIVAAGEIIPVSLTVYDLDGLRGIHIPDAAIRQAAGASGAGVLQDVRLGGLSTTWNVEAADAGIRAAKRMLGRKLRRPRVTLRAGYQLLLRQAASSR